MSKLIVYYGDNPECIEGFSESCKRTNEGALHLRPRQHVTVTDDEYNHILKSRSDLKKQIRVVADKPDLPEAKAEDKKPKEAKAPEAAKGSEKSDAGKSEAKVGRSSSSSASRSGRRK